MSNSKITLINGSCADQEVDVVVNAANGGLWAGGGICGVIFKKAGMRELTDACNKQQTPIKDNGPGKEPWDNASKRDSHNNRHMMVNKLMELDKAVCDDQRIPAIHTIEKMRPEYKNKKNRKS